MSLIKVLYVLLHHSVRHLMVIFFVASQNVKEHWYTYICMSSLRKGHANVCMYTLGMKLPDLAHAIACCALQGTAQLTCNRHAACALGKLFGQCCSMYDLLKDTRHMPKADWIHSAMHACVCVGHVDGNKN